MRELNEEKMGDQEEEGEGNLRLKTKECYNRAEGVRV